MSCCAGPKETREEERQEAVSLNKDRVDKFLLAFLKRVLAAYHSALVKRPILTKSVTSAIIGALGDLLAAWKMGGKRNLRRTLSFFIYCGVITGPLYHWWYGFLERRVKLTGPKNVLAKVAMDRFLMTPPYLALTLFGLRVLETGRPRASLEGARRVYGGALMKNYQVWTVAQLVNFNYVSPAYRVLFGNVVALWWSFYLSTTAASSQR